jgi:hypothetical protein
MIDEGFAVIAATIGPSPSVFRIRERIESAEPRRPVVIER